MLALTTCTGDCINVIEKPEVRTRTLLDQDYRAGAGGSAALSGSGAYLVPAGRNRLRRDGHEVRNSALSVGGGQLHRDFRNAFARLQEFEFDSRGGGNRSLLI